MQPRLGSVRAVANTTDVIAAQQYSPHGVPFGLLTETDFGFTGEMTDDNNLSVSDACYVNKKPDALGIRFVVFLLEALC